MERSTVGSILRSSQAYCGQLCEKQTLDFGIAYYAARFADLPEANQFREVIVEDPAKLPEAFAEAEAFFEQHGLVCRRWAPADATTSAATTTFLSEHRFRPRECTALVLTQWVDIDVPRQVRVLPGRAMRAAVRGTFVDDVYELAAEACLERMDDPPFDLFVATIDGRPAGRCALYQVGDIARVMDLVVLPAFANEGVDRALLARVLGLSKRLAMRNICMQIDRKDARTRWLEEMGFVADGTIVEFERDTPSPPSGSP